ncbi:hypothetical protein [Bacillus thermotolerans]|uniref:hypothetical protein n=1 Tax=Bacillus thermotolerans TaxID=1221996 RepID=UPI0005923B9C|nr:hypothetical protein [Bacillus thermotolerans]KKB44650.1 hypothetical protein QY96_01608 [Bacillus thermotolerans]
MRIEQTALLQEPFTKDKPLQLKDGQVLPAKVVKVLPNEMAELAAGSAKVIAKLEASLQVGGKYWFRVSMQTDGWLLKVVAPQASNVKDRAQTAEYLLRSFSLPLTQENKAVAEMLIREKLVLSKEVLEHAGRWLSKGKVSEGVQTIQSMLNRSLPMTNEIYQSLRTVYSPAPMVQVISELESQLKLLSNPPEAAVRVIQLLDNWQQPPYSKQLIQQVLSALVEQTFSSIQSSSSSSAVELLKSWGIISTEAETAEEAIVQIISQWGKQIGKQEGGTAETLAQLKETTGRLLMQGTYSKEALLPLQQAFEGMVKVAKASKQPVLALEVQQLLTRLDTPGLSGEKLTSLFKAAARAVVYHTEPDEAIRQLSSLFQQGEDELLHKVAAGMDRLAAMPAKLLAKEPSLSQYIAAAAKAEQTGYLTGSAAYSLLKDALRFLGGNMESMLAAERVKAQEMEDMLKPHLLRLTASPLPSHTKELAEQLIGRIQAQSLLSLESGPFQQLVMSLPINLFGFQTDMIMQWSGRRNERGELDANDCRVLFYLELQSLRETIIDMQVRNRFVYLQIYNAHTDLKQLAGPLLPMLEEGLKNQGYQLSSIQFRKTKLAGSRLLVQAAETEPYEGIDVQV